MSAPPCPEPSAWYYVYRAGRTGWKLVCALNEERAMRKVRNSTGASLVRGSSYWQEQRRLGLYPVKGGRRRRR